MRLMSSTASKARWVETRAQRETRTAREAETGMRSCRGCGVEKPLTEEYFWKSNKAWYEERGRVAFFTLCKSCSREQQKKLDWRRTTYGLPREAFLALLDVQGHRCATCGRGLVFGEHNTDSTPHIDHDHETGDVRGILCRSCNLVLGLAKDDPVRLRSLAAYLERLQSAAHGADNEAVA